MKLYLTIRNFLSRHLTPTRIFIFSFAAFILLGTFFLWLPFSASGDGLRFIDALFTAASAVCVTGLTVVDTGKDLSLAGQIITMVLFQIGGLGIITFSVILFTLMGKDISFKGREICQVTFLHTPRRDFFFIVKKVVLYSFVIESIGAVVLFWRFAQDFTTGAAFYRALYHAISAFNNAGFSLFSNSLMSYQTDTVMNIAVMTLIVLGGIGFIVQNEVLARLRGLEKRLSVHTKIVLITTFVLIMVGAICFYFMEMDNALRGAGVKTTLLSSLFQSITARTAGFNTVDIGILTNSTILILILLMFIGASPGSTGGGIKTTSFSLLLLLVVSRFKGSENVNVANRTIPQETIEKTISIVLAAIFFVCLITSVLLFFGGTDDTPAASRHKFVEYLFETVSAFATVGLSMGITDKLNDIQKIAITFMMFAGRVGPLTLAFALYSARKKGITYAEETVMVG
ncbi:MAG TPA: TrkH family potassium uptake protein [Smithellaceae bacterium]|nr:TrkH family potassium uptake protein [Smithellaceae bacterium]HRS88585.1 TrkH family potassium uptake protein [Smithellaceae bacterium]HRV25339.1 TrkH family potassium uptake protein [Smithellaceae bacterium]